MNFNLDQNKGKAYDQPPVPEPAPRPVSKPTPKKDNFVLSIRLNLPDYDDWRAVKFCRQYPYIGLMIGVGALLVLGLLVTLVGYFLTVARLWAMATMSA